MSDGALHLVAREHLVGELECLRAPQGAGHEAFQLTAGGELGGDALEDRWRTSERASSSGSDPASARSMTRAISGADRTSSTASSIGPRQARAAARAGKKTARPAASARPGLRSLSFDAFTSAALGASATHAPTS